MRALLDTDVILDLLLDREPFAAAATARLAVVRLMAATRICPLDLGVYQATSIFS